MVMVWAPWVYPGFLCIFWGFWGERYYNLDVLSRIFNSYGIEDGTGMRKKANLTFRIIRVLLNVVDLKSDLIYSNSQWPTSSYCSSRGPSNGIMHSFLVFPRASWIDQLIGIPNRFIKRIFASLHLSIRMCLRAHDRKFLLTDITQKTHLVQTWWSVKGVPRDCCQSWKIHSGEEKKQNAFQKR